ncbi:MFS transporter [Nonomuraea sp. NN258]|uniref:MFS transporter n=1 Tax=Nonomuraea antri TaxID=2730852 RepID=UPI001569ACDC|nr:MFS transporter [Nonomuraea antri]NRQ34272.1 MFS transporter [Nonomuraea antri]
MTRTTSRALAGRREWIGLAVLALPALLASLELTVTNLALPAIGADLRASSTQLLWIVDVYAFLLSGSLITMGAWGDRIGRRRLLLIGAAAYGVASVLAAYAPDAWSLIAARALMGVTGATLMPSTLSLVTSMFTDSRQRAVAVGVIVAAVSAGTAIGPLAGGWLLERFWWGSAFLAAVPVMAVLVIVGPLLLPEHRDPGGGRLDVVSSLLSLAAVLPVIYGLKQVAAGGPAPYAAVAVLAGALAAWLFVRRQLRLPDPFIDVRLFRDRTFGAASATLALGIFVLWGSNYALAQYLQLVHGLSPLQAGLWTAPSAVGVIVGSTLAPRIVRVVRPATVIGAGLAVSAAGFAVLTQTGGGLGVLVTGAVVVSAGLGPMMALATDLVIGAAPAERAGAAAAIASTAPQLGGAIGIAIIGSVVTAVYRAALPPGEVPEQARESLHAAVGTADPAVVAAARAAFVDGFHLASAINALLMAAIALLVAALLRPPGARPLR